MKPKKIDRIKKQILNALEDKDGLMIKICRAHKKDCFDFEIGDCKDMDMSSCRGSTGLGNFTLERGLKEIEDEMLSLK